ncbi:MAG: TonB family protein [Flammeovirgaceae bacterium]|nr:MAG: TonB family protein [Flammeovirgaceae bacterium]
MGPFYEPKKYSGADLEKIKPLLLSISLTITMLMVVLAFEWKTIDKPDVKAISRSSNTFEEMTEIPQTEIPPPPPPVLQQPRIVEVPNEEEIKEEIKVEFDIDVTDKTVIQELPVIETPKIEEPEEEADKIFLVVEQSASPTGGMAAFYKYVSDNIRYPAQARRMGIEGKVFVEFVVDRDGTLTQFTVVKGIGAGCDEEAVRVLKNAPPWNPGKQRGKPVRQRMVIPIFFRLAESQGS